MMSMKNRNQEEKMKITVENKEIINPKSISVHDVIIEKFEYHYTERICNIEILNDCWNIRQTFCIKKYYFNASTEL